MSKLVQTNRVGKLKKPVVLEFESGDRIEIEAWVEVSISITVDNLSTVPLKEATYEELCLAFTEATGLPYQDVSKRSIFNWVASRSDLFLHDLHTRQIFHRPSPEPTSNLKSCDCCKVPLTPEEESKGQSGGRGHWLSHKCYAEFKQWRAEKEEHHG